MLSVEWHIAALQRAWQTWRFQSQNARRRQTSTRSQWEGKWQARVLGRVSAQSNDN